MHTTGLGFWALEKEEQGSGPISLEGVSDMP